jgi:hypothetical protein
MKCEYGALVETDYKRVKQKYSEKAFPNLTFAIDNHKWIRLSSKPTSAVTDRQITI